MPDQYSSNIPKGQDVIDFLINFLKYSLNKHDYTIYLTKQNDKSSKTYHKSKDVYATSNESITSGSQIVPSHFPVP